MREAGVVAVVPQRALDRDRTVDRRARGVEGGEEAVAGRVHDLPSPGRDHPTEGVVVPAQEPLPRGVAERLREHRRADDVGEHERPPDVRRAGPPLLGVPQLALRRGGIDHRPEPLELLVRGPQLEVCIVGVIDHAQAPREQRTGASHLVRRPDLAPSLDRRAQRTAGLHPVALREQDAAQRDLPAGHERRRRVDLDQPAQLLDGRSRELPGRRPPPRSRPVRATAGSASSGPSPSRRAPR